MSRHPHLQPGELKSVKCSLCRRKSPGRTEIELVEQRFGQFKPDLIVVLHRRCPGVIKV